MVLGLLLGRLVPGLDDALAAVEVGSVSLPIAIGLLVMMYPVLAKVRYDELGHVTGDRRLLGTSIVLNWVVGPALMFALAWLLLPDLPEYRTGLIIVGLARCIAMVLIWNDLACGDRRGRRDPGRDQLGLPDRRVRRPRLLLPRGAARLARPRPGRRSTSRCGSIAKSVLVFLGIPLLAGFLTRTLGERAKGREWYETRFLPRIGPTALYGLLFTIVILFALQGDTITNQPLDVARIALPLLAYFALMWAGSFAARPRRSASTYERDHRAVVHRRRQQLRARHRRRDRRLRGHLRPGARRRRRVPHRGPGPRRPGLRQPLGPQVLPRTHHYRATPTDRSDPMTATPDDSAGRLRLRPQRRPLGHQPRAHRALRRRPGHRLLGRHPARGAHPRRGRRRPGEARPRHLRRTAQAAHPRHDRGQRPWRSPWAAARSAPTCPA